MARFAFDLWLTRFIGNSIFRTTIAMNASFTAHCLNLIARAILPAILCIINLGTAYAWIYPEHRSITLRAIQQLDSTHRVLLDSLWRAARIGHEYRLSESAADTLLGE